jgi:hypothetical protein
VRTGSFSADFSGSRVDDVADMWHYDNGVTSHGHTEFHYDSRASDVEYEFSEGPRLKSGSRGGQRSVDGTIDDDGTARRNTMDSTASHHETVTDTSGGSVYELHSDGTAGNTAAGTTTYGGGAGSGSGGGSGSGSGSGGGSGGAFVLEAYTETYNTQSVATWSPVANGVTRDETVGERTASGGGAAGNEVTEHMEETREVDHVVTDSGGGVTTWTETTTLLDMTQTFEMEAWGPGGVGFSGVGPGEYLTSGLELTSVPGTPPPDAPMPYGFTTFQGAATQAAGEPVVPLQEGSGAVIGESGDGAGGAGPAASPVDTGGMPGEGEGDAEYFECCDDSCGGCGDGCGEGCGCGSGHGSGSAAEEKWDETNQQPDARELVGSLHDGWVARTVTNPDTGQEETRWLPEGVVDAIDNAHVPPVEEDWDTIFRENGLTNVTLALWETSSVRETFEEQWSTAVAKAQRDQAVWELAQKARAQGLTLNELLLAQSLERQGQTREAMDIRRNGLVRFDEQAMDRGLPPPSANPVLPDDEFRRRRTAGTRQLVNVVSVCGFSMVPYVGEALDGQVLADPNSAGWQRVAAGGSLGLNAITGGLLPNAGAFIRAADNVADAAADATRAAGDVVPRVYDVGAATQLRKCPLPWTEVHHVPQSREAVSLVGDFNEINREGREPAIRLLKSEHIAVSNAQRLRTAPASARDLLAEEIRILRNNTGAPNSALQELIDLNRDLHRYDYLPLHRTP